MITVWPSGRRLAGGGIVLDPLGLRAGADGVARRTLLFPEHQVVDEGIVGLDHLGGLFVDDAADVRRVLVDAGLGQDQLFAACAVRRGGGGGLARREGGARLVGRRAFLRTGGAGVGGRRL